MSNTAQIFKNEAHVTGHFPPGVYASASAPFIHFHPKIFISLMLLALFHLSYNMDN